MADTLNGIKVAILTADGFEKSELFEPRKALEEEGAETCVVSPAKESARSWDDNDWGKSVTVDEPLGAAKADDYDALVLPGGVINPDMLRVNQTALDLVRAFFDAGKPIAAICHGPWTLIDAGIVSGKRITSWPSLKTDLLNAGADWLDEEVVVDRNLISSRKPADLPAFNQTIIEEFSRARSPAGSEETA